MRIRREGSWCDLADLSNNIDSSNKHETVFMQVLQRWERKWICMFIQMRSKLVSM